MLRSHFICFFIAVFLSPITSQITVSGVVLDENTQQPLSGIPVRTTLPDETTTDEIGRFTIQHAQNEFITLVFEVNGELKENISRVAKTTEVDLGNILLSTRSPLVQDRELPTITIDEGDDQEGSNISGLLQSGNDLFAGLTNYTFSPARFNRRGLESEYSEGYLNNLPINDLESGGVYWNTWGGLNDVMRHDHEVIGAEISEWGFGAPGSSFNTDLRASTQWKQKRFSYAVTNRSYRNRIMGTWSTGLLPSGWAISLSGSRRWAQEGYIEGTFYDAWSYFASIEKRLGKSHALNLVALGAPYKRGGSSTSIQEMYDLSDDHYYNSFWGYQEGKKRNSKVFSGHQPLFLLRHDFTINTQLKLTTAIGYQNGKNGVGGLDWLNANDPRPDYYRRLPSYVDDPELAEQMRSVLSSNQDLRQVQWGNLYEVNLNSNYTVEDVDGIPGNTYTGALSSYVLEERRSDLDKTTGNIVMEYLPNERSQIRFGANIVIQNTHNFKIVDDLLGGEFYLDYDKYAEQDFPGDEDALQNDLLRPNRIVNEGDQFGYDYYARIRQQTAWISYELNTMRWELAVAGSTKNQIYWRDGLTQNGKFPDNSYGESDKFNFFLPSAKALLRYKIDGRNYVTVSGMSSSMAPTFRNAFVSPRTRDNVVDGLQKEITNLAEIRYNLSAPYIKLSVAGFYITTKHGIESTSFYHDDLRTFVNLSMTGVDKEYTGVEGAVEYKIVPTLSVQGAVNIGQYIYTSRPDATITQDNDGSVLLEDVTIYAKNLYVSGTPQSAYTAGLIYRSKKFWSVYLNVNRFEESWISFNPLRRTIDAVDNVEPESEQWNEILQQEKIDPAWTIDLSFYKSWLVDWPKNRTYFALNIGITNLLNNQDYINGGYEQYRFDFATKDVNKFPSKYSYMQGLNYFVQGSMRF
jgi:hypothetical protein